MCGQKSLCLAKYLTKTHKYVHTRYMTKYLGLKGFFFIWLSTLMAIFPLLTHASTYHYNHANQRVLQIDDGNVTYTPNKYFERKGNTSTKHIYINDMLFSSIEDTNIHYIHTDHLGGTNVVSDQNGDVEQTLDYFPYGSPRISDTQGYNESNKFTGYELDTTGLQYAGQRYYDGSTGRFNSMDPAYLDIGDPSFKDSYQRSLRQHLSNPQALNSYGYAGNDPVKNIDEEGEVVPLLAGYAFAYAPVWVPAAVTFGSASLLAITAPLVGGEIAAYHRGDHEQGELFANSAYTALMIGEMALSGILIGEGILGAGPVLGTRYVNPKKVRYSQTTAGSGGRYRQISESMQKQGWNGPPIDIVSTNKGLVSIDNTRLMVAKDLGISKIPTRIHSFNERLPVTMRGRFGSAKTWGEALLHRTGNQNPSLPLGGTLKRPQITR